MPLLPYRRFDSECIMHIKRDALSESARVNYQKMQLRIST